MEAQRKPPGSPEQLEKVYQTSLEERERKWLIGPLNETEWRGYRWIAPRFCVEQGVNADGTAKLRCIDD